MTPEYTTSDIDQLSELLFLETAAREQYAERADIVKRSSKWVLHSCPCNIPSEICPKVVKCLNYSLDNLELPNRELVARLCPELSNELTLQVSGSLIAGLTNNQGATELEKNIKSTLAVSHIFPLHEETIIISDQEMINTLLRSNPYWVHVWDSMIQHPAWAKNIELEIGQLAAQDAVRLRGFPEVDNQLNAVSTLIWEHADYIAKHLRRKHNLSDERK